MRHAKERANGETLLKKVNDRKRVIRDKTAKENGIEYVRNMRKK